MAGFGFSFRITKSASQRDLLDVIVPKMQNLGNAIATRAQRLVPTDTFALHDSIDTETTIRGGIVRTEVGAGDAEVDYALFVEQGTSRAPAQPYLRPAMLQTRSSDLNFAGGSPSRHGIRTRTITRRATSRRTR